MSGQVRYNYEQVKTRETKTDYILLVEGNSIRSTCRITGAAKGTVIKLLADLGKACLEYQDKVFRNLECKLIQCDEIYSFCTMKEKNVPADKKGHLGYGDVYTYTAMCADSKLVMSWYLGRRDSESPMYLMHDLAGRLKNRIQLTTDGYYPYRVAVKHSFGNDIDFSQLKKVYADNKAQGNKYSPMRVIGTKKIKLIGNPEEKDVSTSYIERQNLTIRMSMRRFTRLTNGFSKKIENLAHAISLHFMYYNFCRIHQNLRCSPAMAAGVTDTLWEIEDIINLLDK